MKILDDYSQNLREIGFKVPAHIWILMSIGIGLVVAVAGFFILPIMWQLVQAILPVFATSKAISNITFIIISIILFLVVMAVMIGNPFLAATKRIDEIEADLPDVLKQMGDTLKAGGTYEYALREVAESEYGAIKKEVDRSLRKLEEGENFETALMSISERVNSRLVKRTIRIIVDSVRAGAALADVLEDIAEDVRATHQINRERKSRTLMQVMFMVLAGGIVAPAIFGFVSTITNILIGSVSTAAASELESSMEAIWLISLAIQMYVLIQIGATSVMMSLMREGKIGKSFIYFPYLLFLAYGTYVLAQLASEIMMGGF